MNGETVGIVGIMREAGSVWVHLSELGGRRNQMRILGKARDICGLHDVELAQGRQDREGYETLSPSISPLPSFFLSFVRSFPAAIRI